MRADDAVRGTLGASTVERSDGGSVPAVRGAAVDDPSMVWRRAIMTAGVSRSYAGAPSARNLGVGRVAMALFGGAAVIVGGVLLFNPYAAVRTLALLLGLALVIAGCMEIALGWDSGRRGSSLFLGGVLVIGGLLAAFWPEVTVWTLAVLAGISLLV